MATLSLTVVILLTEGPNPGPAVTLNEASDINIIEGSFEDEICYVFMGTRHSRPGLSVIQSAIRLMPSKSLI